MRGLGLPLSANECAEVGNGVLAVIAQNSHVQEVANIGLKVGTTKTIKGAHLNDAVVTPQLATAFIAWLEDGGNPAYRRVGRAIAGHFVRVHSLCWAKAELQATLQLSVYDHSFDIRAAAQLLV